MRQANFATFLIVTFIFILTWTGFNIYHSATTSSITPELQQDIRPINGTFDQKTISNITNRQNVQPQFGLVPNGAVTTTTASKTATLTTTPTPIQVEQTVSPIPTVVSVTPGGTP